MSRADKNLTQIIYEIRFDAKNEQVEELIVTTLCAQRSDGGRVDPKTAFTTAQHIAFTATYRFSDRDQVQRFPVPADAQRLLR